MALVTITGFPCSGKSTRAQQLKQYFEKRLKKPEYDGPALEVVVVDDESSHVPRSTYDCMYLLLLVDTLAHKHSASAQEKPGRASLFSNVNRSLGTDTITIVDSANYIKGFRYQMYCAAREAHTRVATVSLLLSLWLS